MGKAPAFKTIRSCCHRALRHSDCLGVGGCIRSSLKTWMKKQSFEFSSEILSDRVRFLHLEIYVKKVNGK